MKKFTKINYILTFILVFCIGATLPILIGSSHVDEQHSAKSEVPYCVTSPTVPEQVTFDGETIGIPDDFKYLMVIESNLNNIARSPAGAAGLWQFMPATGREFGLEVNENVDERYHIEKATVAACKYFKQAYAKYGDWMAVSAAYNAGQGRISSQLDQQLASHAMDLWLVEETSRYMFRLLAVKEIFKNPQRYGFLLKKEHLYPPIPYKEITVTTPIANLSDFAKQQGITYAQLRDANPWLREQSLKNRTGKTYVLQIPTQEGMYYDPKKTVAYNKHWVID